MPPNSSPAAGIATTPSTGRPFRTKPIFTANSSLPAANSRVPSSGSTSQYSAAGLVIRPAATSSSAITGTPGAAARRPATMIASAAWSASVTGDRSSLRTTSKPRRRMLSIAAPASSASAAASDISVSSSMRRSYRSHVMVATRDLRDSAMEPPLPRNDPNSTRHHPPGRTHGRFAGMRAVSHQSGRGAGARIIPRPRTPRSSRPGEAGSGTGSPIRVRGWKPAVAIDAACWRNCGGLIQRFQGLA